jgi:Na+-translocating ferredoxin:NAD+ oxidoreductase RnfD subunit
MSDASAAVAAAHRSSARRRRARAAANLVHGGGTVERFYSQHFQGAVFPLAAGMLLYGWRALFVTLVVVGSAAGAAEIWQRIGRRGRDISVAHAAWLGVLLALALPAHLGSLHLRWPHASFWILPSAGILLSIILWLLRGTAGTALHAVVVTYLLLVPMFHDTLVPHHVLQREHLFTGDVLDAPSEPAPLAANPWWFTRGRTPGHDAIRTTPAAESLLSYTLGRRDVTERGFVLLQGLLRDRLPPLEDLVMAGNPGPIGTSSAIFVIVGGLFLLYRQLIDYRIPLLVTLSALAALLILPIPVAISDVGPRYAWLAGRAPSVGWAVALTFANYELAASPLLFVAFFLATSPTVRPLTGRGRIVFAMLIGVLAAVMQLYVSVSWGPYAALLIAGLTTPLLDRVFRPKPLI